VHGVTPQGDIPKAVYSEAENASNIIGQILDERYQVESQIGIGGMGTVYRAKRLLIGDDVAVKILHDSFNADRMASERFQREAQTAARLKHPNAVTVYDFGTMKDGAKYFVMELVEGQSLREILDKQGLLPLSSVAEITNQVCAALDEAHRLGIIHRDIKPDNIVVHATINGLRVKVLDFGIAKLRDTTVSNLTQTGSIMGTPHFMSPEQCLGEELDQRSDVYSMGIVIFEMLCGRLPFKATVATAVAIQQVNQPPPSLRSINPNVPAAVESVVFHALEKQRDARPITAGTLAHELSVASQGGYPMPLTVTPQPGKGIIKGLQGGGFDSDAQETTITTAVSSRETPTVRISTPVSTAPVPSITGEVPLGGFTQNRTKPILIGVAASLVLLIIVSASFLLINRNSSQQSDLMKSDNKPTPPQGMAYVSGGEFMMGSDKGDEYEKPAHKVTVKPFFMDIYEVTCEDYKKFIDATGHRAPPDWNKGNFPKGAARKPVTSVNWDDAVAYAKWAKKRLPTEEEWEFAARGTDGRIYPWGNEWKDGMANADKVNSGMVDVGIYKGQSPFGIYDMIGNAWEWTSSDVKAYPKGTTPALESDDQKIIRGGYWGSTAGKGKATASFRGWYGARSEDNYQNTSFRCVVDAPTK
jgi:serine/threonine-protein kinase